MESSPAIGNSDTPAFVIPGVVLISCYFYDRKNYIVAELCFSGWQHITLSQNFRSLVVDHWDGRNPRSSRVLRQAVPAVYTRTSIVRTTDAFRQTRASICGRSCFSPLMAMCGLRHQQVYAYLASSGQLGDKAQDKYEAQTRGKFGILAGGRPEVLVSWRAVLDSPILGHGSWAEDSKYSEMLKDLQLEAGYTEDEDVNNRLGRKLPDSCTFPSHECMGVFGSSRCRVLGICSVPDRADGH